jgi:hypothetical protein
MNKRKKEKETITLLCLKNSHSQTTRIVFLLQVLVPKIPPPRSLLSPAGKS